MEKKRISVSLGTLTLIIIILAIIYLSFDNLILLITTIMRSSPSVNTSQVNQNSTVNSVSYFQKHFMSYEEQEKIQLLFPNFKFKGILYYNVYGKRVMQYDETLDLSDVVIDETLEDKLSVMPNIKEVNIYNQDLTNEQKILLKEKFPNITFKCKVDILDQNVDYNVETLDLSYKNIEDIDGFKRTLSLLPNLKKIDLSYSNLSNEELGNLRLALPNVRIDWVVHLGKWSVRTDAVAFSVLITQYDYKRMTSNDIQVLKYCTELKTLDLGHQAIEDISVIGAYLQDLRILILADNKIKDISPIANLKHLHYLELFMNDITDSTPLASCTELVDLNISFNYRFSDISGILNLPKLERLWLISDRISSDSYKLIRETYPNVVLVTTGTGSTGSGWRTHERYYTMIDMYRNNYISDVFLKYDN